MSATATPPAPAAADAFAAGAPVLVGDSDDDVVFVAMAADRVDAARLEALQELSGGMTILGLGDASMERLALTAVRWPGGAPAPGRLGLELAAPVDASSGIRGGWSLADRARTMRIAAAPTSGPADLAVPGHVHPARIALDAPSSAVAALELARQAQRAPAVTLGAVTGRDGAALSFEHARSLPELRRLPHAATAQLRGLAIARRTADAVVQCGLPTAAGAFRAISLDCGDVEPAVVALVHGDPAGAPAPPVHIHVACLLGDALGSLVCDCAATLRSAMDEIVAAGTGVVVYAKPQVPVVSGCGRAARVDVGMIAGLLRAVGAESGRLIATPERLAARLRAGGVASASG